MSFSQQLLFISETTFWDQTNATDNKNSDLKQFKTNYQNRQHRYLTGTAKYRSTASRLRQIIFACFVPVRRFGLNVSDTQMADTSYTADRFLQQWQWATTNYCYTPVLIPLALQETSASRHHWYVYLLLLYSSVLCWWTCGCQSELQAASHQQRTHQTCPPRLSSCHSRSGTSNTHSSICSTDSQPVK